MPAVPSLPLFQGMRRLTPLSGWRRLAVLLALVATIACGTDATAPLSPSIAGRWEGSAALGTVRFEATFTQSGEAVGGTGQFTSPLGSGPFTVTGTVRGQDVQLVLVSSEFGGTSYAGRFTGANTITGRLQDPDLELKITRKD